MFKLPVVLRTDFSDDAAWAKITQEIALPVGPASFLASVDYVDDRAHATVNEENVREALPGYDHSFVILADAASMSRAGHPLLVVDLSPDDEPSFRAAPGAVQSIENNLSIASMDFAELGEAADQEEDGIFRGFDDASSLN
jgi:voltage-gated potassium channel Kch